MSSQPISRARVHKALRWLLQWGGDGIAYVGESYYVFPIAARLANAIIDDLTPLKITFRRMQLMIDLARRELDRMHDLLRRALPIDDLLICAHDDTDHCPCRKPRPGLFTEAAHKWRLTLDRSFVISDKWQDAEAARAVGATSLLVKSPWIGSAHHDFVLPDISAVVEKILHLQTSPATVAL